MNTVPGQIFAAATWQGIASLGFDPVADSLAIERWQPLSTGFSASGSPASGLSASQAWGMPRELVVIDGNVANPQAIAVAVSHQAATFVLNPHVDGLEQISQLLAQYQNLQAIHIVSHGTVGAIQLGSSVLNTATLAQNADRLGIWGRSLAEDADLLVYGCWVGQGQAGQDWMQQLSQFTGADVAASQDLTGNATLSGNWTLEVENGEITTQNLFNATAIADYQFTLANTGLPNAAQRNQFSEGLNAVATWADRVDNFGLLSQQLVLINQTNPSAIDTLGEAIDLGGLIRQLQTRTVNYFSTNPDDPSTETITEIHTSGQLVAFLNSQLTGWTIVDQSDANNLILNIKLNNFQQTRNNLVINLGKDAESYNLGLKAQADLLTQLTIDFTVSLKLANPSAADAFAVKVNNLVSLGQMNQAVVGASGNVGIMGYTTQAGSSLSLNAKVTTQVNTGNPLTLAALAGDLAPMLQLTADTTNNQVSGQLILKAQNLPGVTIAANSTVSIGLTTDAVLIENPNTNRSPTITPDVNFSQFNDFANLTAGELQGMVQQLGAWFNQLSSTGDLNAVIPFSAGNTLGSAISFGRSFHAEVGRYLVPYDSLTAAGTGKLVGDASFSLVHNNQTYDITVLARDTQDNSTIANLVTDINTALNAANVVGVSVTNNENRFLFRNASTNAAIDLFSASNPRKALVGTGLNFGTARLTFSTAQELVALLQARLQEGDGDAAIAVLYNEGTKDLKFTITSADSQFTQEAPLNLAELQGLTDVQAATVDVTVAGQTIQVPNGKLSLSATNQMNFTFGVNLNPSQDLILGAPLNQPNLPANGQLATIANFNLTLLEERLDTTQTPPARIVTKTQNLGAVTVNPDSGNQSIDDLVWDVQRAIDTQLNTIDPALIDASFTKLGFTIPQEQIGNGIVSLTTTNALTTAVLDRDVSLLLTVGIGNTPAKTVLVKIAQTATSDNSNNFDRLIADINAALQSAGIFDLVEASLNTDKIRFVTKNTGSDRTRLRVNQVGAINVEYTSTIDPTAANPQSVGRIVLSARPRVDRTGATAVVIDRSLQVNIASPTNAAYSQLGLLTSPTPLNGQLSSDTQFDLRLNGAVTVVTVTIPSAATTTNQNIDDLIADINTSLDSALGANRVKAFRAIELLDPNQQFRGDGNRIVLKVIDPTITQIQLEKPLGAAIDQLGFQAGKIVTAKARATQFFLENTSLTGAVTAQVSKVDDTKSLAIANYGFLGVEVMNASGTMTGNAGVTLSNRKELKDLAGTLTTLAIPTTYGSTLQFQVRPQNNFKVIRNGAELPNPTLTPNVATWLKPPFPASTQPGLYSFTGLEAYDKLRNIDINVILQGLRKSVDDYIKKAGGGLLEKPLPLLNQSVYQLLNLGDRIDAALAPITNAAASIKNIQAINTLLEQSFGKQGSAPLFSLDSISGTQAALRLDVVMQRSVDTSYGLDLNLKDLTGDSFFSNLIGASSTGDLSAKLTGAVTLALGFDISQSLLNLVPSQVADKIFLYTGANGSRIAVTATLEGKDLDFTAQIGPAQLGIANGTAGLRSGFQVLVTGNDLGSDRSSFAGLGLTTSFVADPGPQPTQPPMFIRLPFTDGSNQQLEISIADLAAFLSTGNTSLVQTNFDQINFKAILNNLIANSPLGILTNPEAMVDGIDRILQTIEDALTQQLYNVKLPLIGDVLKDAGQFIKGFRSAILTEISDRLRELQSTVFNSSSTPANQAALSIDPIDEAVKIVRQAIFKVFSNLNLLRDRNGNGVDLDDVQVLRGTNDSFIQFDFQLGQLINYDQPFSFDAGLPNLGLSLNAGMKLTFDWALDMGFGVDKQSGFFFDTSKTSEVRLKAVADLVGKNGEAQADVTGQLGFLTLQAKESSGGSIANNINASGLLLELNIDLRNPGKAATAKLPFSEMLSALTRFNQFLTATIVGRANLNLDLRLGVDKQQVLPSIVSGLILSWNGFTLNTAGTLDLGKPFFAFKGVGLDLGSFISDFAGPFLGKIRSYLQPLDWFLNPNDGLLYKRFPVISDLVGETVNLKKLIELYDKKSQITPFLNAVEDIYGLIDALGEIATLSSNLIIPIVPADQTLTADQLGVDLTQGSLSQGNAGAIPDLTNLLNRLPNGTDAKVKNFLDRLTGKKSSALQAQGVAAAADDSGISFPILEPVNVIKLLLGQDADLVKYRLPEFKFQFEYTQSFPIFPPLFATLRGFFGATINLGLGYDTKGLMEFRNTRSFLDLLDGIYLDDLKGGVDIPELVLNGGIAAGAALNLGIADAGVEGGIEFISDFNLNDPNRDGKVRFGELGANIEINNGNPLAIFDISARLEWFFRAYIEILFVIDAEMELGRGTLADFGSVNFKRPPILAHKDGATLYLHVGRFANDRVNGNIDDGDEEITVTGGTGGTVSVSGFGISGQNYTGVQKIIAYGDKGNDRITLNLDANKAITTEIYGGEGDDVLTGGGACDRLSGEAGNDTIKGGVQDDVLIGGEGNDTIDGEAGQDILSGDAGNDTLSGNAGNDILIGGLGDDQLVGGENDDRYLFSNNWGTDTVVDTAGSDTWNFAYRDTDERVLKALGLRLLTTTDITFNIGSGQIIAQSLNNTVTTAKYDIENLKGGRGGDIYRIDYATLNATNLEQILLNGQEGSDRYLAQFSATNNGVPKPKITIRDLGNPWDTDRAIANASAANDTLVITDKAVINAYQLDPLTAPQNETFAYNEFPDSGIEAVEAYGKQGEDTIYLYSAPESTSVLVSGDEDNDRIILGGPQGNALLDNIKGSTKSGPVRIKGQSGKDQLIIDDSGDTKDNVNATAGFLTGDFVRGLGMGTFVRYETIERVNVKLGSGKDTLQVDGTIGGTTVIDAGAGADQIQINNAKGQLVVSGNAGNDRIDASNYMLSDPTGTLQPLTLGGGTGDDTILGGDGNDYIRGDSDFTVAFTPLVSPQPEVVTFNTQTPAGNDNLQGRGGQDTIFGEAGNDSLIGGGTTAGLPDETDYLFGGAGNDAIAGDNANINTETQTITSVDTTQGKTDYLLGDNGLLTFEQAGTPITIDSSLTTGTVILLNGQPILQLVSQQKPGEGQDVLSGGIGDDHVMGGGENDRLVGGLGADNLLGDHGTIAFQAGQPIQIFSSQPSLGGDDQLFGNEGDDILIGGAGKDQLLGGAGRDRLLGDNGRIDYLVDANPNTVDLITTTDGNFGDHDTIEGGEDEDIALGGVGDDRIQGGIGNDQLLGDQGRIVYSNGKIDRIETLEPEVGSNDTIAGELGSDIILGGSQNDRLLGGVGADVILGDQGRILYSNSLSNPNVNPLIRQIETTQPGSGGNDELWGDRDRDILLGGFGADYILGGAEDDTVLGDNGRLDYAYPGDAQVPADGDLTTLDFITSTDPLQGGDDTIFGGQGNDRLVGGTGTDLIYGDNGIDAADSTWTIAGLGDFDGDGQQDIAWYRQGDGQTAIWFMEGEQVRGTRFLFTVGNDWQIKAIGDSNGDGKDDWIWQHQGNGDIAIWLMNGLATPQTANLYAAIPLNWQIEGIADTNADGKKDLIWRDRINGDVVVWLLDGLSVPVTGTLYAGIPLNWQIAGLADVDGDGKADLIWRDTLGGDVVVWQLNGKALPTTGLIYAGIPLNWRIQDLADVSGDGKADLIWRDTLGGDVAVWLLNGSTLTQAKTLYAGIPLNWQIRQVLDSNGDGKADLLWQDQISGDVAVWALDGVTQPPTNTIVPGVPKPWVISAGNAVQRPSGRSLFWRETTNGNLVGWTLQGTALPNAQMLYDPASSAQVDSDLILGDHAQIYPTLPRDRNFISIHIGAGTGAGNDYLLGDQGDDLILGQQGNDFIAGNGGEDDLIGGHNVIGGVDGDDLLNGGSQADVVLGDNGTITRRAIGQDWQRYPAPFADVIRDVVRFDDLDRIGGDDRLVGSEGDDILHGQRGDDVIEGGAGDDELYGELGNDRMQGDTGQDTMLGDVGVISREYDANGNPRVRPNGTWKRNVLLTDVASLTATYDPENLPLNAFASADVFLLTGAYNSNGDRLSSNGNWNTPIHALKFFSDGNDIMAGGAGEDAIFGQRGDDILTGDGDNDYIEGNAGSDGIDGGEGDDFLIGDNGDNLSPTHADLPRVTHGYHVIEKAAGVAASFDRFGTILIPKLSLVPQPFLDFVPNLTLVPTIPQDTPIPTIAPLTLPNGVLLKPLMEILPDLNHHVGFLQGNDRIQGNGGKDTIVGDNVRHFMPLRTGIAALDQQFDELVTRFNHLQYDLKDLELAATTGQAAQTLSFGNDLLDGGSDRDSVMADNLTYYSPLVLQPNAATPAIAQTVADLLLAVGRFSGAVNRLLQPFPSATPAITISTGNDVVNGGNGNDKLFGTDTVIVSPVLNDLTYAKGSFWNYGFNRTPHAVRPTFREFDLNLNNDDMRGGNENDLMVGGLTSVIAPIVNRLPVTQNERTILNNSLNTLVRDVKDLIRDLHQEQYGINYVNRNQTNTMNAENDVLNGEAGADILTGDNATFVLPILQGQPDLNFTLTGGNFDVSTEPYNFAHTLPHQHEFIYRNTGGGQTTFGQDTLLGGVDDDLLLGGQFRDRLFGEAGNDFLAGGRDADVLDGGSGTNTVRSSNPSPADQVRLKPTIDVNLQELISPTLARAIAEIAATRGDVLLQGDLTQGDAH